MNFKKINWKTIHLMSFLMGVFMLVFMILDHDFNLTGLIFTFCFPYILALLVAIEKSDKYGLRHTSEHLNEMTRKIAFLPIEEQAEYADQVCRDTCENPEFLKEQFKDLDINDTSLFGNLNTTAVGNMAYLSLHACTSDVKEKSKALLYNYKKWLTAHNDN